MNAIDVIRYLGGIGLAVAYSEGKADKVEIAEFDSALADLDALVQAAQADVDEYLEWRSIPGNEHKATPVMDTLVAALARVTGEEK